MKRKIRFVFFFCSLTVIVFSAWSLIRSLRPSRGKPYERISVEEAIDYMSYEKDFLIVDVREEADYARGHVEGALSLPVGEIVERAEEILPGMDTMLYVYGSDEEESCAAAQKLSDIGYISVTETGSYTDWVLMEGADS